MNKKKNIKSRKLFVGLFCLGLILLVVGALFFYFGSDRDDRLEECGRIVASALEVPPSSTTVDWDLSTDDCLCFDWDYKDVPTFSFTVQFVNYPVGCDTAFRLFFNKVKVDFFWYTSTGLSSYTQYNATGTSISPYKSFVVQTGSTAITSLSLSGSCYAGSSILEIYSYASTTYSDSVYDEGYDDGWVEGHVQGFQEGYGDGLADGYDQGNQDGLSSGQEAAYNRGYSAGLELAEKGDFLSLFTSLIDAPVSAFTSLLDFEIFGYNIKSFVLALLTAALAITALKFFMGMGG